MEPISSAQMRAAEAAAITSGSTTGLALMERAGAAVVAAIYDEWPDAKAKRASVAVLCGPGNNGGDGFVVARLMVEFGHPVTVFFFGDAHRLPNDARTNYDRWLAIGPIEPVVDLHGHRDMRFADNEFAIIVDAFFGIGLTRDLPKPVADIFRAVYFERNWQENVLVAVDILSGIDADTGQKRCDFLICADLTVTFHRPKIGHGQGDGLFYTQEVGKLVVQDIGL